MSDQFFQKPLGIASLVGGALFGPYVFFGEATKPVNQAQPPGVTSTEVPPGHWTSYPNASPTGFGQATFDPLGGAVPSVGSTLPGVADLRDVIRFDVNPAWVTQSFPRVTTVLAETRMDGLRVPFISGTKPTDIAGSLTYYFDAHQLLRRIQFQGTTGDPSMLVALMTQFYRLQPEASVGGHLYTTRWNNRITSVMQLSPAPVIYSHELNNRYQVFLELNQPSNDYGLTLEAEQRLQAGRANQQW